MSKLVEAVFTHNLKFEIAKFFDYNPAIVKRLGLNPSGIIEDLKIEAGLINFNHHCPPQRVICAIEGSVYEGRENETINAATNKVQVIDYLQHKIDAMRLRDMFSFPEDKMESFPEDLRTGITIFSEYDPAVIKFMSNDKPTNEHFCAVQDYLENKGELAAFDFHCEPIQVICAIDNKPYENPEKGHMTTDENKNFVIRNYKRRAEAFQLLEKCITVPAENLVKQLINLLPHPVIETPKPKRRFH